MYSITNCFAIAGAALNTGCGNGSDICSGRRPVFFSCGLTASLVAAGAVAFVAAGGADFWFCAMGETPANKTQVSTKTPLALLAPDCDSCFILVPLALNPFY